MAFDPRIVESAAAHAVAPVDGYSHLGSSALSTRSVAMRDVMAHVLRPGLDFSGIRDLVRTGVVGRPQDETEAKRWARLAMTVGYQQLLPGDTDDAIAMFAVARSVLPLAEWEAPELRALVGLLWEAGRQGEIDAELVDELEPLDQTFLAIDLIGTSDGIASERWIAALNKALAARGVAPIGMEHPGEIAFDRLSSTVEAATVNGPLVTVIMSAYKPESEIYPAVRSVLEQTWADLELLIVDDASGPEFDGILASLPGLDPRIRVLRQPVNRGTYAARNAALAVAAGEFVTFHDSDDWAHPERIEHQMRPLLEDPEVISSHSACVRASPDFVFQRLGYSAFRRLNASSHLFRRSVLDQLGGFDRVRKGADTEFHLRMEAAFPRRSVRVWEPLAFVRLNDNSLSRSDFLPGWWRPDRAEYRDAMMHWHRAIEVGADPKLGPDTTPWPLTAPRAFRRGSGVELSHPDVLLLADWSMDDTIHRAARDSMRVLAESGHQTGVVQVRSIRAQNATHMDRSSRAIRQAITAGEIEAVSIEDDLRVSKLIVVQPDVLQFPTSLAVGISADQVEIIDDGGDGVRWARADVERVVRNWFGVEPTWRPDLRPGFDQFLLRLPRTRFRAQRPVVGWIAESDGSDLPTDPTTTLQVYPGGAAVDVRLTGVRQPLSRCGIEPDRTWLVYEAEDVTAREFWNQIDFAVAAPSAPEPNALRRTVNEALAAGCVVVVPPEFAAWFGDAVIAAEPADMAATIDRLRWDPTAYYEQVARGRRWVRDSV